MSVHETQVIIRNTDGVAIATKHSVSIRFDSLADSQNWLIRSLANVRCEVLKSALSPLKQTLSIQ